MFDARRRNAVELLGIEPKSGGAFPGILRAQTAMANSQPLGLRKLIPRQIQLPKCPMPVDNKLAMQWHFR